MKSDPVCEQALQIKECGLAERWRLPGMCSVGCSVSLMHRGVIAAAVLMAVLSLAPIAIPQQSQSPVPNPASGENPEAGPTIIAPQSSRAGRALFDQKRYAEAKPLLEKACNLGNADSCGLLGDYYFYGYGGVEQDYKQTRLLDKQACEWGSIEGCGNLGLLYEKGLGGLRDYATARALYKKACNGGSTKSMTGSTEGSAAGSMARCSALGMLYLNGQGGAQDYEQARILFRKACDGGFMLGCAALGSLYQNGQGTLPDPAQARTLYGQACNGGEMVGCSWLGRLCEIGLGGPQDFGRARALFRQSCDGGFKPACDELTKLP
jgi:TPR repeat protein